MAVSKLNLYLQISKSDAQVEAALQAVKSSKYDQLQLVSNLLQGLKGGQEAALAVLEVGNGSGSSASAASSVTISGNGAQSVTINGKALVGGTDYVRAGLTPTQIAVNLAKAINESQSSLVQAVMAEAVAAVVQLKAKAAGEVGNLVTLTATGAAAATDATLVGGVDGPQNILKFNV